MRARAAVFALLAAIWTLASCTAWGRARSVATPLAVLRVTLADARDGALAQDLGATLARVLVGALCATVLGGALGIALGARPALLRAAEPAVDLIRAIPPILVYPLCLLGLGHSELSRGVTIAFGAFGVVVVPVAHALARIPIARWDVARLAGLRGAALLRTLLLPEAVAPLAVGARLALTQGLVVAVVTEMLVSPPHGLGVRALGALQEYRADRLWQVLLVAGMLSASLGALVERIARNGCAPPSQLRARRARERGVAHSEHRARPSLPLDSESGEQHE